MIRNEIINKIENIVYQAVQARGCYNDKSVKT